ncbi:transposable element Tcb1 transposase [Trichonephila clavipes]|nr:transposable element Tcb1 transposase [Trichonephila clavipes]
MEQNNHGRETKTTNRQTRKTTKLVESLPSNFIAFEAFGIILRIAVHRKDRTSERRIYTSGVSNALAEKQRSAFDQVSEFDRGRIVAYQDCGLSFRQIGCRVSQIQKTVMRIFDHWMQEGTMDRRGRSHPPQCTTSREDRQIVRMTVTDHSVTSRTIAKPIESVTHPSVSARTIRRRLQQSGLSA